MALIDEDVQMWEDLDNVSWDEFEHAYGSAKDIPKLLRAVRVASSDKRWDAYRDLGASICHQGTAYTASLQALPYLLELIQSDDTRERFYAVDLIRCIAVGCDSDLLLTGYRVDDWLTKMRQDVEVMDVTERKRTAGWGPMLRLSCYDAARKYVSTFLRLLDDKDARLSSHVGYTLAWFPMNYRKSLPRLRAKLVNPANDNQLANFILSTGLLEHFVGTKRTSQSKVKPFLGYADDLVRYSAAIYLGWHGPSADALDVIKQLSMDERFDGVYDMTPFCGGYLMGYAEHILASM